MSRKIKNGVSNCICWLFGNIGFGSEKLLGEGAPIVLFYVGRVLNVVFSAIGRIIAWIWDTAYEFIELIIMSYHACLGGGHYRLKFRRFGSVIAGFTSIAAFIGTIVFHGYSFTCLQYTLHSLATSDANEYSYWVRNWDAYNQAWESKNAFIASSKIASFLSGLNDNFGEKLLQGLLILIGVAAFFGLFCLIFYCFYKAFAWNKVIIERKAEIAKRKKQEQELAERRRRAMQANIRMDNVIYADFRAAK